MIMPLETRRTKTSMATTLEECKIYPPADSSTEFVLPMVFFDLVWYEFAAIRSVLFFDFPCSKSEFLDTIVPDLKTSLSLTLGQFLPLAGSIVHPLNRGDNYKPVFRYESGDSVSLKVCETSADLSRLTGNNPRDCDEFYAFVPADLPPATTRAEENTICCPVLALQVTLFPGQGLCIGFVIHHAAADASTIVSFIKAWATINTTITKHNDDDYGARLREANCLPFFDRKNATNINGLDTIYWDDLVKSSSSPVVPPPMKFPSNKVRATFVLKKDQIQKLKDSLATGVHMSSFTVACALVWACSAKSAGPGGEEVAEDEPEYFGFVADCRGRLKPQLDANYFGNCVALFKAELKHGEAKSPSGFVMAAKAIGQVIRENVYNEKGILFGAENWTEEFGKLIGKRQYGVAESPRFNYYEADYGWGKPSKFEALVIDTTGAICLTKSRIFGEGSIEISMSKPKLQMDAFSTVFNNLLSHF